MRLGASPEIPKNAVNGESDCPPLSLKAPNQHINGGTVTAEVWIISK